MNPKNTGSEGLVSRDGVAVRTSKCLLFLSFYVGKTVSKYKLPAVLLIKLRQSN